MATFRNFKNQSHHFMAVFSNLSNQGVASHSKKKTVYFRLRSSALARNTTHDRKNSMDKRRVKIISRVLDAVNLNFPEAAQFIEDCLEQGCSKENISVDEVA